MILSDRETPRLEFRSMTVDFGATRALSSLTLSIQPGEIVGMLGHNGAGKSTVLNVATGAVSATDGEILVDGKLLPRKLTPKDAIDLGLTVIHQEPALAQNLSVLDNMFLMRPAPATRTARLQAAQTALNTVDASSSISLHQPVSSLTLGQRQMVDLARSELAGEVRVLFLDEPTAALGDQETRALHDLIREFAAQGTAIIYVSHRLPDIIDVCSRIVVLRGGILVHDQPTANLTVRELARALAPELEQDARIVHMPGTTVLEVELASRLTFAENEVVGLFGMAAGPQFAVLDALFGLTHTPPVAQLDGMPYRPSTPRIAIRAGVHLVPGDREQDGLVAAMSAADNVRLPWLFRRKRSNQSTSTTYVKARADLAILGPGADAPIAEFSGGNRQKHLLARWIYPSRPRVLLLAQPTQGVDISAKSDIRRVVRHLAGEGTAVLVASAETDEIATMCDRAYVFFGSHIVEIPRTDDFDEQLLHTLLDLANLPNETKLEPA